MAFWHKTSEPHSVGGCPWGGGEEGKRSGVEEDTMPIKEEKMGGGLREREMRSDAATAMDDMHPPPHK